MDQLTKLLADLVAIPSMNPMGRSRSGVEYSEQQLADYIVSYLRKYHVDAELQPVADGRPNVVAFINTQASQTLLLESHMDTVQSDNMSIDPFNPLIQDGRLYGRGACDTKGSLAAFLLAAISSLNSGRKLKYNILLVAVADEEYCFAGANALAANGIQADFGIAGEPTNLRVIRAHKGVTRWKLTSKGLSAHSAYPQRGKNAIFKMAEILSRLERYAAELVMRKPHPLLGTPTLSVGVIEGGSAVNIVPDRCWIEIDRRSLPGDTSDEIVKEVQLALQDIRDWEFEEPYLSVPGMEVSERAPIVQILTESIRHVLGTATIDIAPYATDAGVYGAAGVPTVVFGPGDIAQAHTANEFIELDQLSRGVDILTHLLLE